MINTRIYKALWYQHHHPQWSEHAATLAKYADKIDENPDLKRVATAIERRTTDQLTSLNHLQILYNITIGAKPTQEALNRKFRTHKKLAQIPEVETAPPITKYEQFTGDYPSTSEKHTCQSWLVLESVASKKKMKYTVHHARLWRDRWVKGKLQKQCKACYHERVWRLCKQVEQEAATHYSITDNPKPLQRKLSRTNTRHRVLPMGKQSMVIHSLPCVCVSGEGLVFEPLPTKRTQLYYLISQWACTPQGQRIGGTRDWGGDYRNIKGAKGQPQIEKGEPSIKVVVKEHGKLSLLLQQINNQTIKGKGVLFQEWGELLELMDNAQIPYAVIQGKERIQELREQWSLKVHLNNSGENATINRCTFDDQTVEDEYKTWVQNRLIE